MKIDERFVYVVLVLELCCNQFTGTIPDQIGSLKNLTVLTLEYNRLSGGIPSSLGDLRMLRRVYLGFNGLSGTIPATFASNQLLEVFNVENNSLSGVVPSGKCFASMSCVLVAYSSLILVLGDWNFKVYRGSKKVSKLTTTLVYVELDLMD